jgi:Poly-gamma-glutamate hydrolase
MVVIAPHGMIERYTDCQAERVAVELSGISCWRCKGWKPDNGAFDRWHITSTDIHEASFPLLNSIVNRGFAHAVAFHGFSEDDILIGGGASDSFKRNSKKR